jgi:N,N'-diacetyllegionaminate synthase
LSDWLADHIFIIAEVGVNHNGRPDMAHRLVDAAADCGADAVKFQTFRAEALVLPSTAKAAYQMVRTDKKESQYTMLKRLELSGEVFSDLLCHCHERGLRFLSSPFDAESIRLLHGLGMDVFKIPSGEINNLPYLQQVGALAKKVILSTGMADLLEVEEALAILLDAGTRKENIVVLHCHTDYPTSMDDVNLRAMESMARDLDIVTGYSDHTEGIEVAIAAAALGARVIEKHFTLDRTLPGPDHDASLEPETFSRMVQAVRNIEKALGDGVKQATARERENALLVRKSIVTLKEIRRGEMFSTENLTVKRPGTGLSPMRWFDILGREAKSDYGPGEMVEL